MKKFKFLLLTFLLLVPVMMFTVPTTASEGSTEFIKEDGIYRIRVEASQWEFKAYDINLANQEDVNLNTISDEKKKEYEVKHRIEFPDAELGDSFEFHLYSRDVQHGWSVNELDMAEPLARPTPGDEFGEVKTTFATLDADSLTPDQVEELTDDNENRGITFSAFCHIFCGLGHPDMKMKLVIAGGALEFGPIVFWSAIAINSLIFVATIRSIMTKIEVVPEETPASN